MRWTDGSASYAFKIKIKWIPLANMSEASVLIIECEKAVGKNFTDKFMSSLEYLAVNLWVDESPTVSQTITKIGVY